MRDSKASGSGPDRAQPKPKRPYVKPAFRVLPASEAAPGQPKSEPESGAGAGKPQATGSEPAGGQAKRKRPYVKPDFRMERVFETNALACGKLRGGGPTCLHIRKNS